MKFPNPLAKTAWLSLLVFATTLMPTSFAAGGQVSVRFDDVFYAHDNVIAIQHLRDTDVVVGYDGNEFRPDAPITRAEFLKIVTEIAGVQVQPGKSPFSDVAQSDWFGPYVYTANKLGYIDGYSDGTFRPNDQINFAEASKIITNVLVNDETSPVDGYDNWFDQYVLELEDEQVIPVSIDGFNRTLTRADMAEMAWRIETGTTYKLGNTYNNVANGKSIEYQMELEYFESCKEMHDYFRDNTSAPYTSYEQSIEDYVNSTDDEIPSESIWVAPVFAEKGGGAGTEAASFSVTNEQVKGVSEADVVKNDGKYIYYVKGNTVRVVDAYPADEMEELSQVTFTDDNFYPAEMYLEDDRLIVVGDSYVGRYFADYDKKSIDPAYYYQDGSAKVYVFDASQPNDIELEREFTFEGDYSDSRMIGDTVYTVVKQSTYNHPWGEVEDWKEEDLVPLYVEDGELKKLVNCEDVLYMPQAVNYGNFTIVAAVPVDGDDEPTAQVVMGATGSIYSSPEHLYMAQKRYSSYWYYEDSGYREETYVHKFDLDGADIDYDAMGTVPGTVLNQFSMDEHDDHFRIVTTLGDTWDEENPSTNNLYVFDEDMDMTGSLTGLAKGERIYSARFAGDRAYIVTFKQIDPLFVVDVEDHDDPTLLGELKIPGFSEYLHPYDENHIIGFGLDTTTPTQDELDVWGQDFFWFQGIKIALFDVTDVSNPIELHREIIGDRGTTSELRYNHKALLYDSKAGEDGAALMAFPVDVYELDEEIKANASGSEWGDPTFQGAYVYDVSPENGFDLRGTITQYSDEELESFKDEYGFWSGMNSIDRIIYIGDHFYTLSDGAVTANEMDGNLEEVVRVIWESLE